MPNRVLFNLTLSFMISVTVAGIAVWLLPSFLVPIAWITSWLAEYAMLTILDYDRGKEYVDHR